jgi:hypothetical protein
VILFYALVASVVTGFLIGRFLGISPFPQMPKEIVVLVLCIVCVIGVHLTKGSTSDFSDILFMVMGFGLGSILNDFLSIEFLAKPSIFSFFAESLTVLIALLVVFWMTRNGNVYKRLRYLFLGVSLISLLVAFTFFVYIVQIYLPLYPQEETTQIVPKFSIIVNIFKSLFLAGLFSFFDRFLVVRERMK